MELSLNSVIHILTLFRNIYLSVLSLPGTRGFPRTISKRMAPTAQTSTFLSYGLPDTIYGAMNSTVPMHSLPYQSLWYAKPKSHNLTIWHSRSTMMFYGFMSRWTISFLWRYANASRSCFIINLIWTTLGLFLWSISERLFPQPSSMIKCTKSSSEYTW